MNIVIIEDEILTARDLERNLKLIDPDVNIAKILQTVDESIDYFSKNPEPDLIFSDIQLGKKLSFEIFKKKRIHSPVIFCTAFNEYALEAFKANGIEYLLKPFNKKAIADALEKYHNLKIKFNLPKLDFNYVLEKIEKCILPQKRSLIVFSGDKVIPIDIHNVALFFVENEIIYAYSFDHKKYFIKDYLDILESIYKPLFFRANRQFLVSRKAIKDASHYFNRKIIINLNIPYKEQIIVSKTRKHEFIKWLTETN